MKTLMTPGRLYASLAAEFRRMRCADCARCVLPLPEPVDGPSAGGPSWMLPELPRECEACRKAIARLVQQYQERYDLLDPLSPFAGIPAHRSPPGSLLKH